MELCRDKLNRERGKPWPFQNQLKHLPRHLCPGWSLTKKAAIESYICPLSNLLEKESLSQGNYFALKSIIKCIAEFSQDDWRPDAKLLLGHGITRL